MFPSLRIYPCLQRIKINLSKRHLWQHLFYINGLTCSACDGRRNYFNRYSHPLLTWTFLRQTSFRLRSRRLVLALRRRRLAIFIHICLLVVVGERVGLYTCRTSLYTCIIHRCFCFTGCKPESL